MGPPTKERPGSRPGRSESQTDEARHEKSTAAIVRCKWCDAEAVIETAPGTVVRATVDHDPECVYFAAIEAGAATAFVMRFGAAIEIEPLEIAGRA